MFLDQCFLGRMTGGGGHFGFLVKTEKMIKMNPKLKEPTDKNHYQSRN